MDNSFVMYSVLLQTRASVQIRSDVVVCAVLMNCDEVQAVRAAHALSDVGVTASVSYSVAEQTVVFAHSRSVDAEAATVSN